MAISVAKFLREEQKKRKTGAPYFSLWLKVDRRTQRKLLHFVNRHKDRHRKVKNWTLFQKIKCLKK